MQNTATALDWSVAGSWLGSQGEKQSMHCRGGVMLKQNCKWGSALVCTAMGTVLLRQEVRASAVVVGEEQMI